MENGQLYSRSSSWCVAYELWSLRHNLHSSFNAVNATRPMPKSSVGCLVCLHIRGIFVPTQNFIMKIYVYRVLVSEQKMSNIVPVKVNQSSDYLSACASSLNQCAMQRRKQRTEKRQWVPLV